MHAARLVTERRRLRDAEAPGDAAREHCPVMESNCDSGGSLKTQVKDGTSGNGRSLVRDVGTGSWQKQVQCTGPGMSVISPSSTGLYSISISGFTNQTVDVESLICNRCNLVPRAVSFPNLMSRTEPIELNY